MQPTSYTLTFSDRERDALIFALGGSFRNVRDGVNMFITPAEYLAMSQRIMHAKPDAQAARQQSGTEAARAILERPQDPAKPASSPVPPVTQPVTEGGAVLRDRWARNQKGQHVPNPEGCCAVTVKVLRISDAPPRNDPSKQRKKVTYAGRTGGAVDAFCWDPELFPFVANRLGAEDTTLHVLTVGKYANIVGIRA